MRKVIFVLILAVMLSMSVSAQTIVSDILNVASLTQAINTVYATYDHIMATIENVQNTYQMIIQQGEAMANMWTDMESFADRYKDKDALESFLEFRNHYKDMVSWADKQMSHWNNMSDLFTKRKIEFAGKNYTLGGIIGYPGSEGDHGTNFLNLPMNVIEYAAKQTKEMAAGYADQLTQEQKVAIMNKYGMSPRNYYNYRFAEKTFTMPLDQFVIEVSEEAKKIRGEEVLANQKAFELMLESAGKSTVSQLQANTAATQKVYEGTHNIVEAIKEATALSIRKAYLDATLEEQKAEQNLKETNDKRIENYRRFHGFDLY